MVAFSFPADLVRQPDILVELQSRTTARAAAEEQEGSERSASVCRREHENIVLLQTGESCAIRHGPKRQSVV